MNIWYYWSPKRTFVWSLELSKMYQRNWFRNRDQKFDLQIELVSADQISISRSNTRSADWITISRSNIRFADQVAILRLNIRCTDRITISRWNIPSADGITISRSNIRSADRIQFIWYFSFKMKKYLKMKFSSSDTFCLILKIK